jgi:hypothetical protein
VRKMGAKALMACGVCTAGELRYRCKYRGRLALRRNSRVDLSIVERRHAPRVARTHLDALLDRGQLRLLDEVNLVEDDAVGEGELLHSLVLHALGLVVVEVLDEVLGVHHREDGVEAELRLFKGSGGGREGMLWA